MIQLKLLIPLCLFVLLSVSCSSDEKKDPQVEFNDLTTSTTDQFIEDVVTINLEGTGYTEANLYSSNTKIKITKIATSVFEISSTVATTATITAELKNNSSNKTKSVTLNFVEHGVKDFNTVEGIKVDVDKSNKVVSLIGEPDYKINSTDGLTEYWIYLSKGLDVHIFKSTTVVTQIAMKSSNYFYTNSENITAFYTNYPYEIGNGWKINNAATTMDAIVDKFNSSITKSGLNTPPVSNIGYQYEKERLIFRFYSDSEDNYKDKKIIFFTIY
ncbi:hypothetical protein [Flavobacterium sp.]|uniref:hypothetical protein n=1 Tax=Flavobacterium sp. TaxID=239 RepID=UPI003C448608